jgi:Ca2+:H+ antiporter
MFDYSCKQESRQERVVASTAFRDLKPLYFAVPLGALFLLALSWDQSLGTGVLLFLGVVLAVCVFIAVSHAEVIALRVGEPFGSLILAAAVTVIEVGMIIVLVIENPDKTQNLARDTVFAAIMITTGAILGASIVIKSLRLKFSTFNPEGAVPALAAIASLSVLSLVLPSFTISTPGPTFNDTQLTFAAVTSLVIYLTFVLMQTVRHRDFFLPPPRANAPTSANSHFKSPTSTQAVYSLVGLVASLVAVVGLAKVTSPLIQDTVSTFGLPQMVVALSIALIVLLPESISALKAAAYGRTQTSINLALGSALASIGMTIPAIAVISIVFGYQVNLGLGSTEIALLFLTLFVSALTLLPGKASLLQGAVHLSIFAAFVLVVFTP